MGGMKPSGSGLKQQDTKDLKKKAVAKAKADKKATKGKGKGKQKV